MPETEPRDPREERPMNETVEKDWRYVINCWDDTTERNKRFFDMLGRASAKTLRLEGRIETLEKSLQVADAKNDNLREQLEVASRAPPQPQLIQTDLMVMSIEPVVDHHHQDVVRQLQAELGTQQEVTANLEETVGQLHAELEAQQQEAATLEATVGRLNTELETQQQDAATLEETIDQLQAELETQQQDAATNLEERVSQLQAELETQQQEATATLQNALQSLGEREGDVARLTEDLRVSGREAQEAQEAEELALAKLDQERTEAAQSLEDAIDNAVASSAEANARLDDTERRLDEAKRERDEAKRERDEAKQKRDGTKKGVTAGEAMIKELENRRRHRHRSRRHRERSERSPNMEFVRDRSGRFPSR
ncbi:hypothetical protein ACJ41O_003491 [Fusarium nematophilum]